MRAAQSKPSSRSDLSAAREARPGSGHPHRRPRPGPEPPPRASRPQGVRRRVRPAAPPPRIRSRGHRRGPLSPGERARLARDRRRRAGEVRNGRAHSQRGRARGRLARGGARACPARAGHGRRRPDARGQVRPPCPQGRARDGRGVHRRPRLATQPGAAPGAAERGGRLGRGARAHRGAVWARHRSRHACRDRALRRGRDPGGESPPSRGAAASGEGPHPRRGVIPEKRLASGFELPVLGLGTWQMGHGDDDRDVAAIRAAIERGITHIDTAEGYAGGHAEELIARAIEGMDRPRLFLVSKVAPANLGRDDLLRSAEASLARLRTDYLDLYLIHHPNPSIPLEETMAAMDELASRGLVRHAGVSNFSVERLREAREVAENPVVADQVHYNLVYREPERSGLLEYCQQENVMLVAWRPVELGVLARPETPILDELAAKYGRTPAQVAINWLIVQDAVVTVVKTSSLEHLEEDLGGVGWELETEDVGRLREEFPG